MTSRIFFIIALLAASLAVADKTPFGILDGRKNTMNFEVWAPSQKDAEMAADSLEKYYKRFLKDMECSSMLKKKPRIYIFANCKDYIDKVMPLGYNVENTGGIAIPRSARKPAEIYSFLDDALLDRVLPHELTHLLFNEITVGLRVGAVIPIWLNEGIAVYEESARSCKKAAIEALKAEMLIPLAEIVGYAEYPADLDKNRLFYAESASVVEFLLTEYGGAKFISFSKKLVSGKKKINEALFSTYYPQIKDVSQLNDAWLEFLKK